MTASGAGLGASLVTNFVAGFFGSLAEQKINKKRINPREVLKEGMTSSIGDTLFGSGPLKGIGNAFIRGVRSGAAVAVINNIFDSFTPTEQERIHDFMRNLPPGTTLVLELPGMRDDPREECGGKNPFHNGVGYGLPSGAGRYNNDSNGSRKGFCLVDFLKDVAAGAVLSGLSGAVYYGGGKAVEALKNSFQQNSANGVSVHIGKRAAESQDISYESILRALRQSNTPEGSMVAKMLHRGMIRLEIRPSHYRGYAGLKPHGNNIIYLYSNVIKSPLAAAGYTAHEAKHFLQHLISGTYRKIHEFEAFYFQSKVDKTFPLRTVQEIWDFINNNPAYKHLK